MFRAHISKFQVKTSPEPNNNGVVVFQGKEEFEKNQRQLLVKGTHIKTQIEQQQVSHKFSLKYYFNTYRILRTISCYGLSDKTAIGEKHFISTLSSERGKSKKIKVLRDFTIVYILSICNTL